MDGSAGGSHPAARRARFGLTSRTVLASVLLGVLAVGGLALMTFAVQQLRAAARSEVRSVQALSTSNRLERSVLDLETGLRGYQLTGKPSFLQPYNAALAEYPRLVRELSLLIAGNPGLQRQLAGIDASISEYVRDWAQPLLRSQRAGGLAAVRRTVLTGGGKRRTDALRLRFTVFDRGVTAIYGARVQDADRLGALAFGFGAGGMTLAGLAVLAASLSIHHAVVRPLRRLAAATARLSAGDLSARVPESGQAEIGDLARGFNAMAASMEQGRDTMASQRARLAEAFSAASQEKARSELLRQFGDRLAAAPGVNAVSAIVLQEMADAAGAEIGVLYLADDSTRRYTPTALRGLAGAGQPQGVLPGEGLAGRAVAERRPVQAFAGHATLRLAGTGGSYPAARELHLPLRRGERTVGVMSLGRASDEPFTPPCLDVLQDLAEQAAVACAEALSRRRVERAAHQLETLLASTDEGVYLVDREGAGTLVNDAALQQTGHRREDLLGHRLHDVLHHSHADGTPYPFGDCPVQQVFHAGVGIRVSDETLWRSDGTPFPVEFSANPLFDGEEIAGVVVTFVDITARKRTEAQRDTQHAVTRVIAAATPGDEEVWERALAAACEGLQLAVGFGWLPRQRGTLLERAVQYAAPGFDEAAARLGAAQLPAGEGAAGLALTRAEPVLLRDLAREPPRTGMPADPRLRSAIAVPAVDGSGQVLALAEFFAERDLAEEGLTSTLTSLAGQIGQYIGRMRAEAGTQRMKDEFISTVSHELRTPLTAISGWLHVLLGGEPGPLTAEQRHFLEIVRSNSDRLMRQVGDLLVAGQIEAGRLTLEFAEVDMAQLAREAIELVAPLAAGKQITVSLDAPAPAVVRGDRSRLLQVLDNLLTNAVKFTLDSGRVGIRVEAQRATCRVTVSDTGIGVPPEDRPFLFQRFYRSSSAAAHGIAGTGLGLAICKAIAEGHHGTIRLAEHQGAGSVFVMELPLAAREGASA